MALPILFDIPAFIIFAGIIFGFLLSSFFIFRSFKTHSANLFMGLFMLTFTLNMIEGWLNYTHLIFKVLHLTNFSEPTNFIIAPLLYLFVSRQLGEKKTSKEWLHYIPFVFWIFYCAFFFMQSTDFKYNSNIYALQLNIPTLKVIENFSDNPLGIRDYVNELTILQIFIYTIFMLKKVFKKASLLKESFLSTQNATLKSLRNSLCHFISLFILLVAVKLYFKNDVGDYLLYIYVTFLMLLNIIQALTSSNYFYQTSSFLEFPTLKYQKSTLNEDDKNLILKKIKTQISKEKYFLNSSATLSDLSIKIKESKHSVSQVINEKLNLSFFELMAKERVEAAKEILISEEGKKLTIDEISERVGYNSKSAFNSVFKKLTSQTPSSYRKLNN